MDYSKLSDYDYHLPNELIAQTPLENRDESRMLVLNRSDGRREHSNFKQLPDYLQEGDLLVLNNTKVIPARLTGNIKGKDTHAEILLLHRLSSGHWAAMVKPGKKLKPGVKVILDLGVEATIENYGREGLREISFKASKPIEKIIQRLGSVPLPPYIETELRDPDQYQTIYAEVDGSAAAPTAGFHFTKQVFAALKERGVQTAFLTLHIGPGTFQPVKVEDIREHVMHFEYFRIENETVRLVNMTRQKGKRVIAVGTTVCRVLETAACSTGRLKDGAEGWTGLYIYPGYQFRIVNAMITNFHLPRSTLLMLVSAFAGHRSIMTAYREAVDNKYRFYSFGDCMLIL
ncbi:MAG: tRNA preQ1(34) S-adenosylmethionine ribosyltransferase-isomerase QueA [Bacillota bacterium]